MDVKYVQQATNIMVQMPSMKTGGRVSTKNNMQTESAPVDDLLQTRISLMMVRNKNLNLKNYEQAKKEVNLQLEEGILNKMKTFNEDLKKNQK